MKINWKLRFKNKVTLTALIAAVVGFVYTTLNILGVVPPIDEATVLRWAGEIISLLVLLGVVVDPTTSGVGDSAMANTYDKPHNPVDDDCMTEAD